MHLKRHIGLCLLLISLISGLLLAWQVIGSHAPKVKADASCAIQGLPRPFYINGTNSINYHDCGNERQQQLVLSVSINGGPIISGNNLPDVHVHRGDVIRVNFSYVQDSQQARPGSERWDGYLIFNGSNNACSSNPWTNGCLSNPSPGGNATLYDRNQNPATDNGNILQPNHCPSYYDNASSPFATSFDEAGQEGKNYPYSLSGIGSLGHQTCGSYGQSAVWANINTSNAGTHTYSVSYTISNQSDFAQQFSIQAGITCGAVDNAFNGCPNSISGSGGGNLMFATLPQNIKIKVDPRTCSDTGTCPVGTATCQAFGPNTAYLGTTAQIPVEFWNKSADINNEWNNTNYVGGNFNPAGYNSLPDTRKQHSGAITSPFFFPAPLDENYGPGPGDLHRLRVNHFENPLANFGVPSPGGPGPVTYTFSIRNDATGAFFGPPDTTHTVCDWTISWVSNISADCQNISLGPGSSTGWYNLLFIPSSGPAFVIGAPAGTWNTFDPAVFPGLYPHLSYSIQAFDAGNGAYLGDAGPFGPCMNASCEAVITPPDGLEPGETGQVQYGVIIYNNTTQGFPSGTYYAAVSGVPPAITGGGRADAFFAAGPNSTRTDLNTGPIFITPNYQGFVHADLHFAGDPGRGLADANINNVPPSFFNLNCNAPYQPKSRPTLKVTNGDISTGGEFANPNQCSTADAAFIGPKNNTDPNEKLKGAIRTFSNVGPGGSKGSSADFAAYALGLIDRAPNDPGRYGFYSDAKYSSARYNNLNFSNNDVLGGLLGGSDSNTTFADAHCATNYFDNTRTSNAPYTTTDRINLNPGLASGQYFYQPPGGGAIDIGAIGPNMVGSGKSITIYVNGDVYISKSITYQNWNFDLPNHTNTAPYLIIIAKGNIVVDPSVHNLDGVYVAQPDSAGNNGIFSTCAPNGISATKAQLATNCHNHLAINGSVIANHVYNLRAADTLWSSTIGSENYNFSPSTIIGSPNLRSEDSLEGLFSQPPVF
jgi:hypothetical protein